MIGAVVQGVRVVGRQHHGAAPVPAERPHLPPALVQLQGLDGRGDVVVVVDDVPPLGGADRDILPGLDIVAPQVPTPIAGMGLGVHRAPIRRVRLDMEAVTAADANPVVGVDGAGTAHGRPTGGPRILQATVDPVRIPHVHGDGVVLGGVDVLEALPARPLIVGQVQATVIALVEAVLVVGIQPDGVPAVSRSPAPRRPPLQGPPAIAGVLEADVGVVGELVIVGADGHVVVVEGSAPVAVHVLPALAAVFGPVDPRAQLGQVRVRRIVAPGLEAMLVMGHEHLGVRPGDGQADLARVPFRKTGGELAETFPPVIGHEDAAIWAAAVQAVRGAVPLPEGHVDRVRVRGVHDRLHSPGVFRVVGQATGELGPTLAAVGGLEEPPVPQRSPDAPKGRHVDRIGIRGMGEHRTDGVGVPQAHLLEALAPVRGLVDPVPPHRRVPAALLTGAHPDDVRVGLEKGHIADGGGSVLLEDRLPGSSRIVGQVDTTGCRADHHMGEVVVHRVDVGDAPLLIGIADVSPGQFSDQRLFEALGGRDFGSQYLNGLLRENRSKDSQNGERRAKMQLLGGHSSHFPFSSVIRTLRNPSRKRWPRPHRFYFPRSGPASSGTEYAGAEPRPWTGSETRRKPHD